MKEYDKAISAAEEASQKDVDKKNTTEIQREMKKIMNAKFSERSSETDEQTLARAMKDPEVQKILQDPVMMRKSRIGEMLRNAVHANSWLILFMSSFPRNSATSTARSLIAARTPQESNNTRQHHQAQSGRHTQNALM